MAHWDNRELDAAASRIVKEYIDGDGAGDMKSMAVKVARESGLNAEQIRRLCRAANVKAFEQKFAQLAGQPDRYAEYDPINDDSVIHELYKGAADRVEKKASISYPKLQDEMSSLRPNYVPLPPEREKTASELMHAIEQSIGRDPHPFTQITRSEKVATELRVRTKSAERRWNETMNDLVNITRRIYWNHDEFEKNSVALHGSHVLPELNAIRSERRMPLIDASHEKVASMQEHLIGEDSEAVQLLKMAADARVDYLQASEALKQTEARLSSLRKAVVHG
jgi:hypothetical protein